MLLVCLGYLLGLVTMGVALVILCGPRAGGTFFLVEKEGEYPVVGIELDEHVSENTKTIILKRPR